MGQEARLSSNIQIPGSALARLRILEVDASMALLLAEVLPETVEEAIFPSDAVASPPGTAATQGLTSSAPRLPIPSAKWAVTPSGTRNSASSGQP